MLNFIHCADIHLGSPMSSRLSPEKSAERRRELRAAFGRMADYAEGNGCSFVLVCGDAFDCDRPSRKDKEYFYNIIKSHPAVQFFYLRGNHDMGGYVQNVANLLTFSGEWGYYNFGPVTVAGIELSEANALTYASTLSLDPSRFNIVMLHGQIAEGEGAGKINLAKLRGKNIDYLALGHVHTFSSGRLDGRGTWAYSGCLEGRGFDEVGDKGFISARVGPPLSFAFVPFASRRVDLVMADISSARDWLSAARLVRAAAPRSSGDMLRVIINGEAHFDNSSLACDVQKELEPYYYAVSVRDESRAAIDLSAFPEGDIRGIFVRRVLASGESEEDKRRIISAGLRALAGRGDEL